MLKWIIIIMLIFPILGILHIIYNDLILRAYNNLIVQKPIKQNHIPPVKNNGYNNQFDNISYCPDCKTHAYEYDHHWMESCPNCNKAHMTQASGYKWTVRSGLMQWVYKGKRVI